jgi:hypothetical protein
VARPAGLLVSILIAHRWVSDIASFNHSNYNSAFCWLPAWGVIMLRLAGRGEYNFKTIPFSNLVLGDCFQPILGWRAVSEQLMPLPSFFVVVQDLS